jgi:hypothetical protein
VVEDRHGKWLEICRGVSYRVQDDPYQQLKLVHHLSGKSLGPTDFLGEVIEEMAAATGWTLHPY